ncbi:phosphotransferase [Actinoplanes flavus]|uniref:Phosphotransferase n=1 Tax=Actinoplanes flavus TaxID=2820290 RepID=A0ABS3UPT6_9ACTN|nr:phosphotransferase [Actinoplanes flavus]MBO3740236.1 phosphotransferase [Actinoplanes flavus]
MTAITNPVDLHGRVRAATADEIGTVRRLLGTPDGDPVIVFAYPGHGVGEQHHDLSGCTSQTLLLGSVHHEVRRLGITVAALSTEDPEKHAHLPAALAGAVRQPGDDAARLPHVDRDGNRYLSRWTLFLGGPRHGTLIDRITDSVQHTRAVIDLLVADRLRTWADTAGVTLSEPATVRAAYANGADSLGIVAFGADPALVAKIGPRDVVTAEAEFVDRVNEHLAAHRRPPLFPRRFGTHLDGTLATSVMEQADPATLDEAVFADEGRWRLRPGAPDTMRPHLELLDALYRTSTQRRTPTVAAYLYRDRFPAVVEHPGYRGTFAALLPGWRAEEVLGARVRVPGGRLLPSYSEAVERLREVYPRLEPGHGCLVHGDVHLRNMMRRADGSPVFVDPRTVWDGRDRPDAGYGDPAYDYATLLHSALPMSGLLTAIDRGTTAELLAGPPSPPSGGVLDLTGLRTPFTIDPVLRELEDGFAAGAAAHDPAQARARLLIGAANALAGWLKYQDALRTTEVWLAVHAYTLWYLDRAFAALEATP